MEKDATRREHFEGYEWYAPADQDRYNVEGYGLAKKIGYFFTSRIEPFADVLGFNSGPPAFLVVDKEVEALIPVQAAAREGLRGLFFFVENAVVVFVEVFKTAEMVKIILLKQGSINCDFKTLANT